MTGNIFVVSVCYSVSLSSCTIPVNKKHRSLKTQKTHTCMNFFFHWHVKPIPFLTFAWKEVSLTKFWILPSGTSHSRAVFFANSDTVCRMSYLISMSFMQEQIAMSYIFHKRLSLQFGRSIQRLNHLNIIVIQNYEQYNPPVYKPIK